jgi:adenylate cyclase
MAAIWEFDGLLNKTVGDAIMAIFNFPIHHHDHAGRAVLAAREIQRRWHTRRELLVTDGAGLDGSDLGIGIGIDTGETSFGEFGRSPGSHRDWNGREHRSSRPVSHRRWADSCDEGSL